MLRSSAAPAGLENRLFMNLTPAISGAQQAAISVGSVIAVWKRARKHSPT